MRRQKGFTLIELLIVVAIIGILAAVAVPNLLNALGRARQKRSMADMRTIATAWEARATDLNKYTAAGAPISWPAVNSDVTAVTDLLTPTYVRRIPLYDGWTTSFKVGWEIDGYAIQSYGADRALSYSATTAAQPVTTNSFDCDIILSMGTFVVYPEGMQGQ